MVSIGSTTAKARSTSRKVIAGASTGATVFVLLVVLVIALFMRKRRQKSNGQNNPDLPGASTFSRKSRGSTICSVREIDNNSTVGPIRELPDSGKAELLDQQTPSGSGNEISELSTALPVVHELRTNRSSVEQFMIQANHTTTCKIFMSPKISRKSASSAGSTDDKPYVETVISASAQRSMIRTSTETSQPKTHMCGSYMRKPLDLNRSLPPLPFSESPTVPPVTPTFQKSSSFYQRPKAIVPASRVSTSISVIPKRIVLERSETLDDRECSVFELFPEGHGMCDPTWAVGVGAL